MRRKGVPRVKYSSVGRERTPSSSKLGVVMLLFGLILILVGGLRVAEWCFFTGFILVAVGTFISGVGAVLIWRIYRILEIVAVMAAVLIMTAFLFGGSC